MPSFKGRHNGSWKDAAAVYGKSGGSWLYGKSAWAKKDGTWQRTWTDCRKYDAGGRDWSSSTATYTDASGCDSCGTKSKTVTTYTKTGCPDDVRDPGYGACSSAWTAETVTSFEYNGYTYYTQGTAGYYSQLFSDCRSCPSPCITSANYYVTVCPLTGSRRFTYLSCEPCTSIIGGEPC